tara:strand:- start:53 stop:1780 length:1728 start_codon:yes stop_codon:yes gene_type:complete
VKRIKEAIGFTQSYGGELPQHLEDLVNILPVIQNLANTKQLSDDDVIIQRLYSLLSDGGDLHVLVQELIDLLESLPDKPENSHIGFRLQNEGSNSKSGLLVETGITNINDLSDRYSKAEIYFHQDLDGVVTAIAMKNYLENYGINVIDAHVIQYGDKEFSVKKPQALGEVMPVLVDFAHGKPVFTIHTDHHDSQSGVEDDTSTQFRGARSNVETISQVVSPYDIFTSEDIHKISTIDSADYAAQGIEPEDVMNYLFKLSKTGSVPKNKWMLALLTNKLLLAYKNKPDFLETLVMNSSASLLNIYLNIIKIAKQMGYATPEEMLQNQLKYIDSQSESKNLSVDGKIIVQYGGGALFKPGSYDRYTPFKLHPEADFLVIAWPMGLVQASCNPFKEERALKGINLGEIAQEVLGKIEPELKIHMIPISVIKRIGETKATDDSIGFKTSDLFALYKDNLQNMPSTDSSDYDMVVNIIDMPWERLTDTQKEVLDNIKVSAWDVIQANSGGHKCITNISGLNFFSRATRNPEGPYKKKAGSKPTRYVEFVKWVQKELVSTLKEKIESSSSSDMGSVDVEDL